MNMDDSDDDDLPLDQLKKKKKTKKAVQGTKDSKTKAANKPSDKAANAKRKSSAMAKPDPAPSSSSSKKRKAPAAPISPTTSNKKVKTESKARELKKMEKAERLQYAMQSFLWWNAEEPPEGNQWVTMEHAGVSFPEPYVPHGVKMKYDGKPVDLTLAQEEA